MSDDWHWGHPMNFVLAAIVALTMFYFVTSPVTAWIVFDDEGMAHIVLRDECGEVSEAKAALAKARGEE